MIYKHGGRIGDCLYSLPTIRYLGGGTLYLETERSNFGVDAAESLLPLLETVSYLDDVHIVGKAPNVACDLNQFRHCKYLYSQHLTWSHFDMFGVPHNAADEPWLNVRPHRMASIVINRSLRTHGEMDWKKFVDAKPDALFVGLYEEHQAFVEEFGRVDYYPTADLLQVAELIRGADLFIGNQSASLAIAEALAMPAVVEVGVAGHYQYPFRSKDAVPISSAKAISLLAAPGCGERV